MLFIREQVQERVIQEAASVGAAEEPQITSKLIRDCLFANELGDGILFSILFRNKFLYCQNTQEWFEWSGHAWKRDVMSRVLVAVEDVAKVYLREYDEISSNGSAALAGKPDEDAEGLVRKCKELKKCLLKRASLLRAEKRRAACLNFAHTIKSPLSIAGEAFDNHPMLFPCANGVIDLETGKLRPGRPGDYLLKSSPVEFRGIDEPAPRWEKIISEIFDGNEDLATYFQRLLGYCITGLVNEKVFPILYGRTGWNGRTLIIETVSYIMGNLAGSIPSEMLLATRYSKNSAGPSPDIMSLKGLRMAFASEVEEGQLFSTSRVKWLTGKDELVGRNPHDKYPTRFRPTHKLILMANSKPKAPPNDLAFWERVHLIPFAISFVNRDPAARHERRAILDLDRHVLQEASGILAWLVRGCLLYQKHGLKPPRDVKEATKQYRRDEDLLADFLEECCVLEAGGKEKASELYARFVEWYHDNIGKKEPTGTWFGKQLSQKQEKHKGSCIMYHGISIKK